MDGDGNRKYQFYRKPPSVRHTVVRHTKTSLKRIIQANPLIDQLHLKGSKSISDVSKNKADEKPLLKRTQSLKRPNSLRNPPFNYRPSTILSGNGPTATNCASVSIASTVESVDFQRTSTVVSSTFIENPPLESDILGEQLSSTCSTVVSSKPNGTLIINGSGVQVRETQRSLARSDRVPKRRSLSAQHYEKKRETVVGLEPNLVKHLHQSVNDVTLIDLKRETNAVSPIMESSRESLVFKTPSAYERRSIARLTPMSSCPRRSIYCPSTPLPSLDELEKRLNAWLSKRGKNVARFSRLKSFAVENVVEENKENVEVEVPVRGSYEDLCIPSTSAERHDAPERVVDMERIAKDALSDLLGLIQEGYPVSHCEEWLSVIKHKYKNLQQEPVYWECRAAIEEGRGNIGDAVDCYKAAIVRGAEVSQVDKSLDTLLQKFSLLNISPAKVEEVKASRERERILKDARNVFKSSIIKFAVAAKKMKENKTDVKLVATPVRRSSRRSRSAYTSTPGIKIYSTFKEVKDDEKNEFDFQPNRALD